MILISWTLPLAVCAATASPLRQAQIAGKLNDSHLLDTPARCVRSQGFSFDAGPDCRESHMPGATKCPCHMRLSDFNQSILVSLFD